MKILNLIVVLGLVFGWNMVANAAEDDFGLEDVLFEDEEKQPSEAKETVETTQQKVDAEEAKLDEVIKDIDADIPDENAQVDSKEEKTPTEMPETSAELPQNAETSAEHENVEETSVEQESSEEISAEQENIKEEPTKPEEKSVSAYIKKLDLSDEQMDKAKFINSEMEMRQEQLQKSVDLLKAQAREIEEQSLKEFEAILTPDQKETFEKLRQIDAQENEGE